MSDRKLSTHDYTTRGWGHDYTATPIDGGLKLDMAGWGYGLRAGDYLLLKNGTGSSRYKIEALRYKSDPPDMWFATAAFAPRSQEELDTDRKRGVPVEKDTIR